MSEKQAGKVYLIGAGPGAPNLITVRGAEVMGRAEVVIHDQFANPGLLRLAPESAEFINAGRKGGGRARSDHEEINRLLIDRARAGRLVVRLTGGDPFIFGRGSEEALALARAGVEFEIVPGVASAIAAPSFAGIPLTHREHGSFVAFISGHEDENPSPGAALLWSDLASAASRGGTLVLLIPAVTMREDLKRLIDGGLPGVTPAAAIQWGTTARQKTVLATLATLADEAGRAGLSAPAVVVVGECARLRNELGWFEKLPLFGRRIVVTRAEAWDGPFSVGLRALGAEVIEFPTIRTVAPDSYEVIDRALSELGLFDWVIFTSATGVDGFIARLKTLGRDIRELAGASLGAIGPATARHLADHALKVAATPTEYRAEAILDAIGEDRIRGARFLIPRAQVAREALPRLLREKGAREVVVAPAYKTVKPDGAAAQWVRSAIGTVDLVAFTSSNTVNNFCDLIGPDLPKRMKAAVIGPITDDTARARGFEVVVRPQEYTIPALTAAIAAYFRAGP
jgi:uroporphyrinogen III methyltransferase / synthase